MNETKENKTEKRTHMGLLRWLSKWGGAERRSLKMTVAEFVDDCGSTPEDYETFCNEAVTEYVDEVNARRPASRRLSDYRIGYIQSYYLSETREERLNY